MAAHPVSAVEPFEGFLKKHCQRCHGSERVERELRIDRLSRDFKTGTDGHLWAEIVERINSGEMPPEDEPQPTVDEKYSAKPWPVYEQTACENKNKTGKS